MSAGTEQVVTESKRRVLSRRWTSPLLVLLVMFGLYAGTAERSSVATDAFAASVGAWRLASTGQPWLDDVDLDHLSGTHWWNTPDQMISPADNGHVAVQRMAGPIVLGVPFYFLLGRGTSPADFSLVPGALAAAWFTALAVMLMFLALRRCVAERLAWVGTAVFGLATPTWAVTANGLWTHTVTQLGLAGAAWSLATRRWWLVGLFLGISIWGRPHMALVAAVVGLGLSWSERRLAPAVRVGLPSLGALVALMVWNHWWFGAWSLGGAYGDSRLEVAADSITGMGQWENYAGFLFSPNRGFLVWSPVLLLLVPAVVRSWRELPAWTKWLALGGVAYSIGQMQLNHFSGGEGFFAYRHALELMTCLVPLVVMSVPATGRMARMLLPPAICLQVGAMLFGALVEGVFVPVADAWTDSGLLMALRLQPVLVGSGLLLCVGAGVLLSVRAARQRPADHPVQARQPRDVVV